MRRPFINVNGHAERQTEKAVLITKAEFVLNGQVQVHDEMWIPLANLMEDSQDTVEEAVEGEAIEIFVAKWFLEEQ